MRKLLVVFTLMLLVVITCGCSNDAKKSEFDFEPAMGGAFDLGIANDEKLIEMLKREGTLAEDASPAVAEEALRNYLKAKMNGATKEEGQLESYKRQIKENFNYGKVTEGIFNGLGNKVGQTEELNTVVEEVWDDSVTKDNILVILIDYPDFNNSTMTPDETDMFYDNYTKEHYEEMIFGDNGYIGPNGEQLISMKQFYEAQSGGSYSIEGQVVGWYTAQNPAAYYGGNIGGEDGHPRSLVYEALLGAANDPDVDLSIFDNEDRYDLDGDGNYREPDGLIDHLMIIHAGAGEEAGGGSLGEDAIWSHRWNLGGVATLPGTEAEVPYWGGELAAYDYTMEPEDGAAGVFSHEYGHDLGLVDEYDTIYSGAGEPVSFWSVMSTGSWAGIIPGTEPPGFSPYAKMQLQTSLGGNWISGSSIHVDDINENGIEVLLDQASTKGTNNDVLKIELPEKEVITNIPYTGEYEYFSGKGNNVDNYMLTTIDLTQATSAKLQFKAWYQIEVDWDYASIGVMTAEGWTSIQGNITTSSDPYGQNPGYGITGYSNGWVDAEFDLSQFVGQEIYVGFNYWTDGYVAENGLYVDDIRVSVNEQELIFDDAESNSLFDLFGFTKDQGKSYSEHYYLVEWRNHEGVDEALAHIKRGNSLMEFDPGMLVWYVDKGFDNNWTGVHPGDGYLGVVDADQHLNIWSDRDIGSTRYQVHDAAFSLENTEKMYLDYTYLGFYMKDYFTKMNPLFDDSLDYSNSGLPDAGRNIPNYGLKIRVIGESEDRTVAKILLYK
ncbi:immune inhibitor A [Mycoplasmatota bacterium zrk1]